MILLNIVKYIRIMFSFKDIFGGIFYFLAKMTCIRIIFPCSTNLLHVDESACDSSTILLSFLLILCTYTCTRTSYTYTHTHWYFFCFSYSRLSRKRQKLLRDESILVNAKSIKRTLRKASVPVLLKRNRHLHTLLLIRYSRDKLTVVLNCSVISKTIWFAWSSTHSLSPKT